MASEYGNFALYIINSEPKHILYTRFSIWQNRYPVVFVSRLVLKSRKLAVNTVRNQYLAV